MEKMTKSEEEVLYLLNNEFLTVKQISIRRKTKDKITYRLVANLKKKGLLNQAKRPQVETVDKNQSTPKSFRLHGIELNIKIMHKDERYKQRLENVNLITIDGNTIRLYENSVEIYVLKSFFANDVNKCSADAIPYLIRIITALENDLKVILLKDRYQNIKVVNSHYAEVGSELAQDRELSDKKLMITSDKDGKMWYLIDNSFNLHEGETVHSRTSKMDMIKVQKQLNDWRNYDPPTNSEIMFLLKSITQANLETAAGLNSVVQILKSHIPNNEYEEPQGRADYFG